MHETLVPIFFAIITAACFGGQLVIGVRSFAYVDPQTSSMITIGTCVVIFWLLSPFLLKAEYFTNPGMWIFFANGLIYPIFSIYLAFEASKRMGPTVSATISAIAPLFATIGAVLLLGEHITIIFLMGTICTVAGIMILSWKRQSQINWALPVLILPLGAAVIRGANHNIGKFGLQLLPSPYFASLIAYTVSFVGAIMIYRFRTGRLPTRLPIQSIMWSGLAGICTAVGVLSMYSALHYGRVIVVSPIISTFPFFNLLISLLFRQEQFRLRLLTGMVLVVGGVIWVSIQ
ncbi:DMT family transporter [Thermodesulfobacteriota bacterium]